MGVAEAQVVAPSSPSAGGLDSIKEEISTKDKSIAAVSKQELDAMYKESLLLDGTLMPGGDDDDDDTVVGITATTTPKSSTTTTETPMASVAANDVPAVAPPLKKKKKKKSYKNM